MTSLPEPPGLDALRHEAQEEKALSDIVAGDVFRNTLLPRADSHAAHGAPLWYGWAIMDAFLAGVKRGRAEGAAETFDEMDAECERLEVAYRAKSKEEGDVYYAQASAVCCVGDRLAAIRAARALATEGKPGE